MCGVISGEHLRRSCSRPDVFAFQWTEGLTPRFDGVPKTEGLTPQFAGNPKTKGLTPQFDGVPK
ncbi:MAG: hypothetical protein ACRD3J_28840, partial [Thermoanaerobaculia bacterium]